MAEVIGNICSHGGKYLDKETQEEKSRWNRHGTLLRTDKGLRIKLDSIPVGEFNGWLMIFTEKPKEQSFREKPPQQGKLDEPDDNIPF
jgi:hypothetical protein